jgi:ribonuclease P protein component
MRTAFRLRKSADFKDVRKRGRRMSDRLMILGSVRVIAPDIAPIVDGNEDSAGDITRFGLAVSKRVGNSVTRNKVKRRLREGLSALDILPGYNIVVSARPEAAQADYRTLSSSLRRLAGRAGVLQPDTVSRTSTPSKSTVNQSAAKRDNS